jgi:hypothetical protein
MGDLRDRILEILPDNPEEGLGLEEICKKMNYPYTGAVSKRLWSLKGWRVIDHTTKRGPRLWWRI